LSGALLELGFFVIRNALPSDVVLAVKKEQKILESSVKVNLRSFSFFVCVFVAALSVSFM
jgi:hypothetical protein